MCETETVLFRQIIMEVWKDYYGYKISNKGKVLNRFGKEVKGYIQKDRGYEYKVVLLRIDGKRKHLHLNTLVCSLFNENYQQNARVYRVDGDIKNCSLENLKISKAYTQKPTIEQIKIYEKNVVACCKDYFNKRGWFECVKQGIDIDDCLHNAYYYIWKYLASYTHKISFYVFCVNYCKIAFAQAYKKYKTEQKWHCIDYQGKF